MSNPDPDKRPPFPGGNLTRVTGKPFVLVYSDGDADEFDAVEDARVFLMADKLLEAPGSLGAKIYHFRDGQWIEVN